MDKRLIEEKIESLRRCIRRLENKCPETPGILERDIDLQDIVTVNLTRAVQLCVDIGAHLIAESDVRAPDTMGGTFDVLGQIEILDKELVIRMKKAVGFRNIAVHNYGAIDWQIVFSICRENLEDFRVFAKSVVSAIHE